MDELHADCPGKDSNPARDSWLNVLTTTPQGRIKYEKEGKESEKEKDEAKKLGINAVMIVDVAFVRVCNANNSLLQPRTLMLTVGCACYRQR